METNIKKDKGRAKTMSWISKIFAILYVTGHTSYQLIFRDGITITTAIAIIVVGISISNMFMSVDISLWLEKIKEIKGLSDK